MLMRLCFLFFQRDLKRSRTSLLLFELSFELKIKSLETKRLQTDIPVLS